MPDKNQFFLQTNMLNIFYIYIYQINSNKTLSRNVAFSLATLGQTRHTLKKVPLECEACRHRYLQH